MNKLHKSAFAVLATIVMGLSLFTNTAAQADGTDLTMSISVPTDWHFGDLGSEITYTTSGDAVEFELVVTNGATVCGPLVGDDATYAGDYVLTPQATVTSGDGTVVLAPGQTSGDYTFNATLNGSPFSGSTSFTILPFDAAVSFNGGNNFSVYEGQYIDTTQYSVVTLPYGNTATVSFIYSGGGIVGSTSGQPITAGTYTITPQGHFSPDEDCNFNTTGTGRLVVNEYPVNPIYTPTPTPTPTATPSPSATPLKKATITVTGGTYSYDGSPKSATVTTNPAGLSVSVKYAGGSSAPVNSGTYGVVATITAKDYEATEALGTIVINKINPILKWNKPAKIKQGTPVTSKQLNATANVKGTFTYTVDSGAVLAVGTYDAVADFAPEDAVNYNTARTQTVIEVVPGARSIVVTFSLGSAKIPASVLANIRANAALPGEKVIVYGYVQPSNSLSADKKLSQQRADALAAQILKLVPSANVVAIGKGRTTNDLCVSANNKCAVVEFTGK